MATPNVSSVVNFVKKYPITLCGFSLLFMPSVYRLLLYFTPLLISTAIFIVAMMSWGPSMSSERGKRRGKRNDYAFNGSLKIYDDDDIDDDEEGGGGGEEEEVSQKEKSSDDTTQQQDISIHGKTGNFKPDPQMKLERKLHEPDPDYDEKSKCMGTASNSAISGGQADLHGDRVGAAFCNTCSALSDPDLLGECVKAASHDACSAEPYPDLHAERNTISAISGGQGEPDTDLHGDRVGAAFFNACSAEPDPDLHGEHVVEAASQNTCSAEQHVDPANDQDFSASNHLHAAPDHHHLSTSQHYAESEPINPDQQAAEPDPDLHGECATHANSDEAHVENDDMHAAISELRQKLGMMKRTAPYSDDPRDILSHQPAELLQTLQAAA